MTETSEIDKAIIKERYGAMYKLVSSMTVEDIAVHIQTINARIADAELTIKASKAEYAACASKMDELNEIRRASGFSEYVVPKSHTIVKAEKASTNGAAKTPKVDSKDKPIIDMYKSLKSVDAVIGLMGQFIPEQQIRAAISKYDLSK